MKVVGIMFFFCFMQLHLWSQNTILTANLKGLKHKKAQISYDDGKQNKQDNIKIVNGKFTWKGNIALPQEVYIFFEDKMFSFFAQSGHLSLTGIADSTQTYVVKGSKLQEEYLTYSRTIKELTDQEDLLYDQYGLGTKEQQLKLEEKLQEIIKEKLGKAIEYIHKHPSSYYSLHLVKELSQFNGYPIVKNAYESLSSKMKETRTGSEISTRLRFLKRSEPGTYMKAFKQNDTLGVPMTLADFKGKYVLVDFWASWCGPCRGENPNLLKAYNEYKDKNFTIVGLSLDDKAADWKKAIREDNMPWAQLSDLKGWKNEVSSYYGIQGIPSNFLLDPSGKIIAKDLRGELLHKKLAEVLN